MVFVATSIVVPIALYCLIPKILHTNEGRRLLLLACIAYAVSWYLPSPLVNGQDTSFGTHFLGGGVFSGLLGLYLCRAKGLQMSWQWEAVLLFALVSALGSLNELFEVLLWSLDLMPEGILDTSWDIVANTLGATAFYMIYRLYIHIQSRYSPADDRRNR